MGLSHWSKMSSDGGGGLLALPILGQWHLSPSGMGLEPLCEQRGCGILIACLSDCWLTTTSPCLAMITSCGVHDRDMSVACKQLVIPGPASFRNEVFCGSCRPFCARCNALWHCKGGQLGVLLQVAEESSFWLKYLLL